MTHPLAAQGAATAEANANRKHAGWSEYAYASLIDYGLAHGAGWKFQTSQVRQWAEAEGLLPPPDKRAWGAITTKAKRAGLIVCAGFAQALDPASHGSPMYVWEWTGGTQ